MTERGISAEGTAVLRLGLEMQSAWCVEGWPVGRCGLKGGSVCKEGLSLISLMPLEVPRRLPDV